MNDERKEKTWGIEAWVQKAVVQANKVLQLVAVRVDHESANKVN